MPLSVHAIVVTRQGASATGNALRALEALAVQTRQPDEITVVVCGDSAKIKAHANTAAIPTRVVQVRAGTRFSQALAEGFEGASAGKSIWILDDDCVPVSGALEQLVAALERSPLAAIAAPKLRSQTKPARIVSFGVSMTKFGRSVELTAGQIDQGQHDGDQDALAADARGMLVRGSAVKDLLPDPALDSVDVGLDIGVRARLAGGRVVLTPLAHVEVAGALGTERSDATDTFAMRRAQLHRRLAYAPLAVVLFHWLSLLPLALWRSLLSLIDKKPAEIAPEWSAAIVTAVRVDHVVRARARIRQSKTVGWSVIEPLRLRKNDPVYSLATTRTTDVQHLSKLRFFAGGGAVTVGLALLVSVVVLIPLLTWDVLGGGALLPLRETLTGLWSDASWGIRPVGVGVVGPADLFSIVVATLGSLVPWAPSTTLVWLWLLAIPLAALGGWFAATRVTERASLRIAAAALWAFAPTFVTSLVQEPRPAAVIVHLVLPWFVFAVSVAHRSWGAAGAASLLLIPMLASAPSLAPAVLVLWIVGVVVTLVNRNHAGAARVFWVPIPTLIFFAPLLWAQLQRQNPLAIFADPGRVWLGSQVPADAAGRLALISGFPTSDYAGWGAWLGSNAAWVGLLMLPLVTLAVLAPLSTRWRVGLALFAVTVLGLGTAMLAPGIALSFDAGTAVPLWPGSGLSLAWVGIVGGALLVIETAKFPRMPVLPIIAVVALATFVATLPALSSLARGESALQNGPESTLPAYVAADARGDLQRATLVITPLSQSEIAVRAVWGTSDTLGAQSTLVATAVTPIGTDITKIAVDLISPAPFDAGTALSELGIRYVLVAEAEPGAAQLRADAIAGLNQRADLLRVGDTDSGELWRVDAQPVEQALTPAQKSLSTGIRILLIVTVVIALLLALPTRASRRAARLTPRIVGGERPE